ncbi:putative Ig domain-containing protein [Xanthomonas axonopodis]|uniref:putative Ig domain-containing protein n=1 Tax=Xanthomonas axonopodis TaxID=53413 RepID=UPI003559326B
MNAPTISEYLSYANLQMAAEAFIRDEKTNRLRNAGAEYVDALTAGNDHASRFVESQATKFAEEWQVIDQRANTKTGFSGTLFRRVRDDPATGAKAGETVLSFRSTEFIDDAARDNKATNELEIKNTGYAWGQLADMQAWYAELKADPAKLGGGQVFSVTGYSLGGHLATAFNLMNAGAAQRVVTFNGAGVGKVLDGTLQSALAEFNTLRGSTDELAARFTEAGLAGLYRRIQGDLAAGRITAAQAQAQVKEFYTDSNTGQTALPKQGAMLMKALQEIQAIGDEAVRVTTLVAGGTGEGANASPKQVLPADIAGMDLNYRLAMQYAGKHTESASLTAGAARGYGKKEYGERLGNQYDVVGDTSPSVVANSQWHSGQDVRIGIEDQPLYRGAIGGSVLMDLVMLKSPELLDQQYAIRDFGDTHSLVLLVDSLSVQSALLSLMPEGQRDADGVSSLLKTIYKAATWREKTNGDLLVGDGQGKAEGDLLEQLVNSLADMVLGPKAQDDLKGNTNGGTWARTVDQDGYTGRNRFFEVLDALQKGMEKLKGQFGLVATDGRQLASSAREDFGDYLALRTLSPFALRTAGALQAAQEAIGEKWAGAYADWKADRASLAQGSSGSALHVSDQWLADRSDMLARKNWFNTADKNPLNPSYVPREDGQGASAYQLEDSVYEDMDSGYKIQQGGVTNATRHVLFGNDADNVLTGKGVADRLYGGEGADTLDGQAGDDYLEGGAGRDVYRFKGRFGNDVVRDDGGAGVLEFDGAAMPLAVQRRQGSDDVWEDDSGLFVFTRIPKEGDADGKRMDVRITKYTSATNKTVQGSVTIRDFRSGDFGLTLGEAEETVQEAGGEKTSLVVLAGGTADPSQPADWDVPRLFSSKTSLRYEGTDDAAKWVFANDSDGGQIVKTGAGDDRIFVGRYYESVEYSGPENWAPRAGEDEDHVVAGAGDDVVLTGYGSDTIEGGDGNDRLYSGAVGYFDRVTPDTLQASAGRIAQNHDVADAGSTDVVDGGGGDDWIRGGMGGDVLLAGSGNDTVFGMEGDDLLVGGLGDDRLYGDGVYSVDSQLVDETIRAYDHRGNDTLLGDAGNDRLVGGVGEDQLFGGDGNDNLFGDGDGAPGEGGNNMLWIPGDYQAADTIDGGSGNDFILGGGGADVLSGGAGDDTIRGDQYDAIPLDAKYQGADRIDGGDGNDQLYGDGGNDVLAGGAGDDRMFGGEADDRLDGGDGGDQLYGEAGADVLMGGGGDDRIFGGNGDDWIAGGAGTDRLDGGQGNDVYYFDKGDYDGETEIIADEAGVDRIVIAGAAMDDFKVVLQGGEVHLRLRDESGGIGYKGGFENIESVEFVNGAVYTPDDLKKIAVKTTSGDDVIQAVEAGSTIDGQAGNDDLAGNAWDDILYGGFGNDRLTGLGGNDMLDGGDGDDQISSGATGRSIIVGGAGRDILDGGTDDTVYRFGKNSGMDIVSDAGGTDSIEFDAGISPADVIVRSGVRTLSVEVGDAQLLVRNFSNSNGQIRSDNAIEYLRFADGTVWNLEEIRRRSLLSTNGDDVIVAFDGDETVDGGSGNDKLWGNDGNDRLTGGAGHDYLDGGAGRNTLDGGDGNDEIWVNGSADTVRGGAGDDVYWFHGSGTLTLESGFGHDRLRLDPGASARIELKEGLQASRARVTSSGEDVKITFSNSESIVLEGVRYQNGGDFYRTLPSFNFADGTVWTDATLQAMVRAADKNHAPVLAAPLADARASAGTAFNLTVSADAFKDEDAGDTLTYRATRADGSALPSWLGFDAATRTFSGTPAQGDVGAIDVQVTATDGLGAAVSDTFSLVVDKGNRAPVAEGWIGTQYFTEQTAFRFTVPDGLFSDPDGDALQFSVRYPASADWKLPAWISFDAATRTFTGTPPSSVGGQLFNFEVVATDTSGASMDIGFALIVNQAPEARQTIAAQSFKQGGAWNFKVPTTVFVDDDKDALVYGATLANGAALPAWLTFDAQSQTFKAAANAPLGTYEISVSAKDPWGAQATQKFAVTVQSSTITGTSRNDTLTGTTGNDTIDGLAGADTMTGLAGDDTYIVDNTGDKAVEAANAGTDTVMSSVSFTLGANVENLVLAGSGAINGTGNELNNRLTGSAGANVLTGGAGADYLDGGAGTDTLAGGLGNDTYWLARGYGTDTVQENDTTSGNLDIAKFANDVSSRQLWFRKSGNNLEVSIIGTSDKLVMSNWYAGSQYQVERFQAGDGKALQANQVQSLVQAMASFSPPAAGQTSLPANYQSSLETTLAANWK